MAHYAAIMATRLGEPFIDEALASIAGQSLPPKETFIILNGPGADASPEAESLRGHALTPTVLTSPTASQSAAYSLVLDRVQTPFVAFLDADDVWHPTKQERQISALESESAALACVGGVVNFQVDGVGRREGTPPLLSRLFGAVTFRTMAFTRYGRPDPTAEHFTWLYRWWGDAKGLRVVELPVDPPVLQRRVHGGSGWVTAGDEGRRQLLAELRRRTRPSTDLP